MLAYITQTFGDKVSTYGPFVLKGSPTVVYRSGLTQNQVDELTCKARECGAVVGYCDVSVRHDGREINFSHAVI